MLRGRRAQGAVNYLLGWVCKPAEDTASQRPLELISFSYKVHTNDVLICGAEKLWLNYTFLGEQKAICKGEQ